MKRGLVVLDPAEIPETEWRDRISALQRQLSEQGIDIALIYGDVFRSDDIAYLTNLCIYWNEGVLAVPADGEPVFLTKLSPRVHSWMRRTSTVRDIHSGRSFGALASELVADRPQGTLGLVEAALWPAAVVDEITAACQGWQVTKLDGLVRRLRSQPSEHELALLRQGAAAMNHAVDAAMSNGLHTQERIAASERILRAAGFTDVVARATESWLEITGQFRNHWLRASRAVGGHPGFDVALRAAVDAAADGVPVAALADAARAHLPGDAEWTVRVIDEVDLVTNGEYASHPADRTLTAGTAVVISLDVTLPDGNQFAVADTVVVGPSSAQLLTGLEVGAL
jgi:hypothetical protein